MGAFPCPEGLSVLARLRRLAAKLHKPYQTYIHELLEQAAGKKVA